MPTVPLHPRPRTPPTSAVNPLPQLLHTPSGLALLELQGSLNFPVAATDDGNTDIGHFVFADDSKRVWLYIGQHQRMTGELKKLSPPVGVLRRRRHVGGGGGGDDVVMGEVVDEGAGEKWEGEELEIAEVVEWKVVFSGRPEPVGNAPEEGI